MAARFNTEEVLVMLDDNNVEEEQSVESSEDEDEDEEKLGRCLDSFEGGEGFNKPFFKENAIDVLMPLVRAAKPTASQLLSKTNINAGTVLHRESRLWLRMIMNRLAGRVSVRKPYYEVFYYTFWDEH
ncbi:hypothetical protein QZH41_005940 [Actinostola sp. cb2023]|nr:hypothetical protein QZH41_005940 [Actinostola sp. cb2023]